MSLAFTVRTKTIFAQDVPHALVRNDATKIGQCAGNPVISPRRIVFGELNNEFFNRRRNGRSPVCILAMVILPFLADKLAMPFEQGFRLNDGNDVGEKFGIMYLTNFGVGRATPCAPSVANPRLRRAEDCPPYQFYLISL